MSNPTDKNSDNYEYSDDDFETLNLPEGEESDAVEDTADLEEFPPPPSAQDEPAAKTDDVEETADLPDAPPPEPAADKSISDTAVNEADESPAEDVGATVIDPELAGTDQPRRDEEAQTVIVDDDAEPASAEATVLAAEDEASGESLLARPDIMQTINTRDLSPQDAEEFQRTLVDEALASAEAIADAAKPSPPTDLHDSGMQAADEGASQTETQLVIQRRQLIESKGATAPVTADYELLELLGEGGMGVVYAANQTSIDRQVAIKMLKAKYVAKKKQRDNFLSEAVVTGDLDHPNIVPIYDVAKNESNALFYSMKRVKGIPWRDVLDQKSQTENIEVLMKVADAVAFAHSRGVVHRDLKPENIMLGDYGEVLVMDWGLALTTTTFAASRSIAPTASMGCTPAYAAPELVRGPRDKIGPHSDVYLLGAILYQLVSGEPPHRGGNVLQCLAAATGNVITPTDEKGELVDIALKAMQTEPEDRYADVKSFQHAIREYQSHSESLLLSGNAAEDLEQAQSSNEYNDYAQAVYGFKEALDMWDGNSRARDGLRRAKLAYAQSAQSRGDFDLGMSLLDVSDPEHAELHGELRAAKAEVDARANRLKTARRVGQALVAAILVIVSGAAVWINAARQDAVAQRAIAVEQRDEADKQRTEAERQEQIAKENEAIALDAKEQEAEQRKIAVAKQKEAEAARIEEEKQRKIAVANEKEAKLARFEEEEQRKIAEAKQEEAEAAREEAVMAQEQERIAKLDAIEAGKKEALARKAQEYEAYVAQIGLAAERVDDNAFDDAVRILEALNENARDLLNWEWHRLWYLANLGQSRAEVNALIDAVAFGPDAKTFITGSQDGNARIWTVAALATPAVLEHGADVRAVAYSRSGKYVATGGDDGVIRIWDPETGEPAGAGLLRGHRERVTGVEFAPRPGLTESGSLSGARSGSLSSELPEAWLVSTSYDGTAVLWNVETGEQLHVFRGHSWWVWDASFSPAGDRLVTAGQDRRAIVWSLGPDAQGKRSFEMLAEFDGHKGPVYSAAFSRDGRRVVSGDDDGRVLIWDPANVKGPNIQKRIADFTRSVSEIDPPSASQELKGHKGAVHSVSFSIDGSRVVSGSDDNTVKVWNAASGRLVKTLRGHAGWVRSCVFAPVEGSDRVLSGSHDGQARIWDVTGYAEVHRLASTDPTRRIEGHDAVLAVAFDAEGKRLVTGGRDQRARLWDAKTGEPSPVQLQQEDDSQANLLHEGHAFLASTVIPFDGGRKVLTSAMDNSTRIWDAARGTELARLTDTGQAAAAAVSPDGVWIATGGSGRDENAARLGKRINRNYTVRLWKTDTVLKSGDVPKPFAELDGHDARVTALAFSPDGKHLFSGDNDGIGILWQTSREPDSVSPVSPTSPVRRFTGHVDRINAAVFSEDGTTIATAGDDYLLTVWDRATGTRKQSLPHPDAVTTLAIVPGKPLILTGCGDNKVRLWKAADTEPVRSGAQDVSQPLQTYELQGGRRAVAANVSRLMRRRNNMTVGELARRSGVSVEVIRAVRAGYADSDAETLEKLSAALGVNDTAELERPSITGLSIAPDGERAYAVNSSDGMIHALDLASDKVLLKRAGFGSIWTAAVFQSDGQNADDPQPYKLVTVGGDDAHLWDLQTVSRQEQFAPEISFSPHAEVTAVAFTPDGKFVVTASSDGSMKMWNTEDGKSVFKFPAEHSGTIHSVGFSRVEGSSQLLTAGADGTAVLWQWDAEKLSAGPVRKFAGHKGAVYSAAFSPDDTQVLTTSEDGTARIWNADDPGEFIELKGHDGRAVRCGAFAPDGTWVVTGGDDRTARMWDAATGEQIRIPLQGHTAAVTAVDVSPLGTRILTGSRDKTAKLWDPRIVAKPQAAGDALPAAREILTLRGHEEDVTAVAFSKDGLNGTIATGSLDGTAILWLAEKPQRDEQKVAGN